MNRSNTAEPFKTPSVMRYDRVQTILESEPVFKNRLGPKEHEIKKRSGDTHRYAALVVEVTNEIHRQNLDAHNVPRSQVLRVATDICALLKSGKIVSVTPSKKKVESKPEGTKSAEKVPETADKHAAKPKSRRVRAVAPAAASTETVSGGKSVEAEPYRSQEKMPEIVSSEKAVIAVYSNIAKLSLCTSLRNLMELDDDKYPGFEKRREAVDFLIADFTRIKDIPTSVTIKQAELKTDVKA